VLSPDCADPFGRKAIRTSARGTLRVPFAALGGLARRPRAAPRSCYDVLALAPDGTVDLRDLGRSHPIGDRVAILLGKDSA
jgi:tRNA G18 (ribose-2'-O)-methylase SpoU